MTVEDDVYEANTAALADEVVDNGIKTHGKAMHHAMNERHVAKLTHEEALQKYSDLCKAVNAFLTYTPPEVLDQILPSMLAALRERSEVK